MFPVSLEAPCSYLNHIPLFFKPLSLWSRIFLPRNFSDHCSRLLLVVFVVLSRLGLRLLFSFLVWYVFLLLPLFTFSCSGFRGSLGDHCLSLLLHFLGWSSVARLLTVWSYCSNFRVIGACLAEVPPFYHSFDLPYSCSIMRTSFGPNRSSSLRIGGSSTEEPDLGQIGEGFGRPALVIDRDPPAGPPFPSSKGKSKVSEIRYPRASDYLRATAQNAEAMGPSWIEPSFGKAFATRYRPPFGVHVWCPDCLTSYIVQVPKMICFFEAAFENDLRFPLHPFIKSVCSTLTSVHPNSLPISGVF